MFILDFALQYYLLIWDVHHLEFIPLNLLVTTPTHLINFYWVLELVLVASRMYGHHGVAVWYFIRRAINWYR